MNQNIFASPTGDNAATAPRRLASEVEFERLLQSGEEDVVALFVAPWSRSGQRIAEDFAERVTRHRLAGVTIDVDAWSDLARRYDVTALPSILHFRRGQIAARRIGEMSAADLDDWLAEIAPPAAPVQRPRRRS